MLNRIRRAITRTRERHAPKAAPCHPRTRTRWALAPRAQSVHEYALADEETALICPYVLTPEERMSWRAPAASTWRMATEAH